MDYSNADTSRFDIRNADGSTVAFVDFTKEFKYLGSIIDSSLTSYADVDMRIKAATSAFGALKKNPHELPRNSACACVSVLPSDWFTLARCVCAY